MDNKRTKRIDWIVDNIVNPIEVGLVLAVLIYMVGIQTACIISIASVIVNRRIERRKEERRKKREKTVLYKRGQGIVRTKQQNN